jgi:hypothetical protein
MPYQHKPTRREEGMPAFMERTMARHNGNGYTVWCKMIADGQNRTALMRAFNIKSYQIMNEWLTQHFDELGQPNPYKEKHAEKNTNSHTRPAFIQQPD